MSSMHAQAALAADSTDATVTVDRLEQVGLLALFGVAVALQFSIAVAQSSWRWRSSAGSRS